MIAAPCMSDSGEISKGSPHRVEPKWQDREQINGCSFKTHRLDGLLGSKWQVPEQKFVFLVMCCQNKILKDVALVLGLGKQLGANGAAIIGKGLTNDSC